MESPLIKINSDDAEKIARLYDIGDDLANKIVQYRESKGYFNSPDDLARVKGISLLLAETLSPHIDWNKPADSDKEYPTAKLGITDVGHAVPALILIFFLINYTWRIWLETIWLFNSTQPFRWISIWINVSIIASGIFVLPGLLLNIAVNYLVKNLLLHKKLKTISHGFFFITLLCVLSVGIGNFFRYQFRDGWSVLLHNPIALSGLWCGIVIFFMVVPWLLIALYPSIVSTRFFAKYYDIFLLLLPLTALIVASIYVSGEETGLLWYETIYLRLTGFLIGVVYLYLGIKDFRNKKSFVQEYALPWLLTSTDTGKNEKSWLLWLNSRLPDPENQKALREALNRTYQPSKLRTFISIVTIGVGGWLILQSLGAIIQWIVGKGLDSIFK